MSNAIFTATNWNPSNYSNSNNDFRNVCNEINATANCNPSNKNYLNNNFPDDIRCATMSFVGEFAAENAKEVKKHTSLIVSHHHHSGFTGKIIDFDMMSLCFKSEYHNRNYLDERAHFNIMKLKMIKQRTRNDQRSSSCTSAR